MAKILNIKDKKIISKKRFCPPHWWPHTLPWKKITDEPCHIHKKTWRMQHHTPFCKYWLKCPNYEFMIKKYKNENN
ncbi:MAG: hypothetical protein ABIA78_00350, partial [archaeon]